MEGRVYLSSWKKSSGAYDVWVKSRPKIRARAESFENADEALYERILEVLGDGESTREYDPPRPDALDHDGLLYRLKAISGTGRALIANEDMAPLWTGGVCPDCHHARGKRTRVPVTLQSADSENGLSARAQHMFDYPGLHLYSADFLALLTPAERRRFTWRPVQRAKGSRGKKEYFEIVASKTALPLAAFKEQYVGIDLTKCPTCGYKDEPGYAFVPPTPSHYVSEKDVPRRLPSCFTVSRAPAPKICFTTKRWAQLVNKSGARGLVSLDIGVIDARLVDRRPKYANKDFTPWPEP